MPMRPSTRPLPRHRRRSDAGQRLESLPKRLSLIDPCRPNALPGPFPGASRDLDPCRSLDVAGRDGSRRRVGSAPRIGAQALERTHREAVRARRRACRLSRAVPARRADRQLSAQPRRQRPGHLRLPGLPQGWCRIGDDSERRRVHEALAPACSAARTANRKDLRALPPRASRATRDLSLPDSRDRSSAAVRLRGAGRRATEALLPGMRRSARLDGPNSLESVGGSGSRELSTATNGAVTVRMPGLDPDCRRCSRSGPVRSTFSRYFASFRPARRGLRPSDSPYQCLKSMAASSAAPNRPASRAMAIGIMPLNSSQLFNPAFERVLRLAFAARF